MQQLLQATDYGMCGAIKDDALTITVNQTESGLQNPQATNSNMFQGTNFSGIFVSLPTDWQFNILFIGILLR